MRTPALGLVGATGQPTFNVDLFSLLKVLVDCLGQTRKGRAVEPFDLFPLLSGAGGVFATAGYAEAGNGLAVASALPRA